MNKMCALFLTVLCGLFLLESKANALEYPLQANTQIIYEATTVGMGAPPMLWRYEIWLLGEREPGKFEAVFTFFNYPKTPNESMAGALPLTIDKYGAKLFPREREVTYSLQEMVEGLLPNLSGITAMNAAWKGPSVVTGRYFSYQPVDQQNGFLRCSFAQYGDDKIDQAVGLLTSGEAFFDPASNMIQEVRFATSRNTQQGQVVISQAQAKRVGIILKDEQWSQQRRDQARDFFTVLQSHDEMLFTANDDLAAATLTLGAINVVWQDYLAKNATSLFAPLGRNHLQTLQVELPALQSLWVNRKRMVGQPAPDWTLKDTAGNSYTMSTLPAQPIMLMFWSRYSWDALMALREIPDFKAKYEPRGMIILPINLDATDQEAVDALAQLGINMTTLRNTDVNLLLANGIPPGVIPSAVLIDRNKMISAIHFGWGKRVYQRLRDKVEGQL